MNDLMTGMIAMGFVIAGLHFHRFWYDTKDRLFLFFALAFYTLGVNRIARVWTGQEHEQIEVIYWIRFAAFLLILVAIIDKNFAKPADSKSTDESSRSLS